MQYLHEDRNAHLYLKFERQIPKKTVKPLSKIIVQGVKEKLFDTKFPVENAKAFIGISAIFLQGIYYIIPGAEEYKKKIIATFDIIKKMLRAKPGLILKTFKKKGEQKYAFI